MRTTSIQVIAGGVRRPEIRLWRASFRKVLFTGGANVVIKELDDVDLMPTGVEHIIKVSNDLGEFEFANSTDITSSYVEISANGSYFNEVYGIRSYFPVTLSAFTDISVNQEVNVNLLTTIALKREKYLIAQLGRTYEAAKIQARNEVLNLLVKRWQTSLGSMEMAKQPLSVNWITSP